MNNSSDPTQARPRLAPRRAPQFIALRAALAHGPAAPHDIAHRFTRAPRLAEMLATLAALGQARPIGDGRYVA